MASGDDCSGDAGALLEFINFDPHAADFLPVCIGC